MHQKRIALRLSRQRTVVGCPSKTVCKMSLSTGSAYFQRLLDSHNYLNILCLVTSIRLRLLHPLHADFRQLFLTDCRLSFLLDSETSLWISMSESSTTLRPEGETIRQLLCACRTLSLHGSFTKAKVVQREAGLRTNGNDVSHARGSEKLRTASLQARLSIY